MTEITGKLTAALSDRYKIERELGAGGTGPQIFADGCRLTQTKSDE